MDCISIISSLIIFVLLFDFQPLLIPAINNDFETYIVHVQSPTNLPLGSTNHDQKVDLESWYLSFLPTATTNDNIGEELESKPKSQSRLIYSYKHVFYGFAARLTKEEVKKMRNKKGFISADLQEIASLHTTHSPDYLGFIQNSGLWKDSNYGKGVIIGVVDSGITPEHPSFRGDGVPNPPTKWKGKCQFSPIENTTLCNNKLIGVRYFYDDDHHHHHSSLDESGHGTHIASIAAGNYVQGANVYGNANGTAKGVAPLAHLAIYKVCRGGNYCPESAIIAGLDAAIDDGVDIISISHGYSSPLYNDNYAISAFSAIEKGIVVCVAAGNSGPDKHTLASTSPWMLVVGASTIDRKTVAIAKLGNDVELEGQSIYQPHDFPSTMLSLVYPISLKPEDEGSSYCFPDSFDYVDIKGKIVVCSGGGNISQKVKGKNVKKAGGAAMIYINSKAHGNTIMDVPNVLPVTYLSYVDGVRLLNYIKLSSSPTATILYKGTSIGSQESPIVGYFSSRGPSIHSPGILKPDILGPGVNIVAAYHVSVEKNKNEKSTFNIMSGTSMACPHLSGVVALLKSAHPDWAPAAIMSAIITSADHVSRQNSPIQDEQHQPANIFTTGAGHVNPLKANNPGLVYNINRITDYISYLCSLDYTDLQISKIVKRNVNCFEEPSILEEQLNYPSILVYLGYNGATVDVERTVTNVGDVVESYTVQVDEPLGVSVIVQPTTLSFEQIKQNLTYAIKFTRLPTSTGDFAQGSLSWISPKHTVRSPIVTTFTASF